MALTKVIGSGIGTVTNQFSGSNIPAGGVIQVVEGTLTSQFSTTSTSYTDVGLSVAITPNDDNNKIALLATFSLYHSGAYIYCTINKNHSGISDTNLEPNSGAGLAQLHAGGNQGDPSCIALLDSPATTNEVTYRVRMKVQSGTGYLGINSCASFLRAMEIVV